MDTTRTIHEIEADIAQHFGVRENIIVPNVSWGFFKTHEADMVIISKSGYLSEVEIKRSWSDFVADFKKHTNHYEGKVYKMYYCVPDSLYERVKDYLINEVDWQKYGFKYSPSGKYNAPGRARIACGIMTYTDNGYLRVRDSAPAIQQFFSKNVNDYKLYIEEKLAIARLGTLRYWAKNKQDQ